MAVPNLIAVLLLSNVISQETKKYINDLDAWDNAPVPTVDENDRRVTLTKDTRKTTGR